MLNILQLKMETTGTLEAYKILPTKTSKNLGLISWRWEPTEPKHVSLQRGNLQFNSRDSL